MAQEQRKYEKEYKVQAVKLAKEIGEGKAAKELGIPVDTLYGWQKAVREGRLDTGPGAPFPKKRTVKTEKKRNEIVEMRDREIKRRRYREKPQSERETASRGQNGDA